MTKAKAVETQNPGDILAGAVGQNPGTVLAGTVADNQALEKVAVPPPQKPSEGRTVLYRLRGRDVMSIRDARLAFNLAPGNDHQEGQLLPAMIVRVFNADGSIGAGASNLKVSVDAAIPDLWITSATRGDGNGQWNWPPRV